MRKIEDFQTNSLSDNESKKMSGGRVWMWPFRIWTWDSPDYSDEILDEML